MIIAVTGGIGAGKSVVCHILRTMGYPVYDCDQRARAIMDSDFGIHRALAERISPQVIGADGCIDRRRLADIVFHDPEMLDALNGIVHAAVRADLGRWIATHGVGTAFVETAILYQSGLDKMVDAVWDVDAPEDVRVARVCLRNNLCAADVKARINSQRFDPRCPHPSVTTIINDDRHSLLRQIHQSLEGAR